MALLILALLQRIFLMSSLMLLLVWLIFFMVLIKLLPILGTIDRKSGSAGMPRSEERFSRNAETDLVCRLLLEKKKDGLCPPLRGPPPLARGGPPDPGSGSPRDLPSERLGSCPRR